MIRTQQPRDSRLRSKLPAGLTTVLILVFVPPLPGAPKSWNSSIDGMWNVSGNWAPSGVPASGDEVTLGDIIGTEGTRTTMDIGDTVGSLTMIEDTELDTASHELVADSVRISDATLLLKPNNGGDDDSLDVDFMDVADGGTILMLGGRLEIDGHSGDGRLEMDESTLAGFGFIDLEAAGAGSKLSLGFCDLDVGNRGDAAIPAGDVAKTLVISAIDAGASANFDASHLTLLPSGTLDLDVALSIGDTNSITLRRNSILDVEDAWSFGGSLNVDTEAGAFAGTDAGPAEVVGGEFTQTGGSINLDGPDDKLVFDAGYTGTGGVIDLRDGSITFRQPASIGSGVDFDLDANGDGNTALVVSNTDVTVNDSDWDWDGSGASTNSIIIGWGSLNANITASSDRYSGAIYILDGHLNVQGLNDEWGQDGGSIEIADIFTSSLLGGDRFLMTGGTLLVGESGSLNVETVAAVPGVSGQQFSGGTVTVNGVLTLGGDFTEWAGSTVNGAGTIEPGDTSVSANQTIGVAVYDWDSGTTTVENGATFTLAVDNINVGASAPNDWHGGRIDVDSGTLDVTVADGSWQLGAGGILNLADTGGGGSTLAEGSELEVLSGGRVNTRGAGNMIDTDVVFEEGSRLEVQAAGEVALGDADDRITLAGGDIVEDVAGGTATNGGSLSITGDSVIDVTTFKWDSGDTNIEAGGALNITVTDIDTSVPVNRFDGTLNINGGALSLNCASSNWVADRAVNFDGGGVIAGDPVWFGTDAGGRDADLGVSGTGVAIISAPVTFLADADLFIDAGATLRTVDATFESVNGAERARFTGSGSWEMIGTNTFNEETFIEMSGGTVDLDNSILPGPMLANDTYLNADVTISAAMVEVYGVYRPGNPPVPASNSTLEIADDATLTVILDDPDDGWTVNSMGIINYSGGAVLKTFLDGADLQFNGTLNVTGGGHCAARMDIAGWVDIMGADSVLQLGGGSIANPNTVDGRIISGDGQLGIDSGCALRGSGVINTGIDANGSAELIAFGGTLDVNGPIVAVGTLRADGAGTILDLADPFDSGVTQNGISLDGGLIQGAGITLSTHNLRGNGMVTSQIDNNNVISAEGGRLVVNNSTNEWDGSLGDGALIAQSGDLELIDNGDTAFAGVVVAESGHEVFANGFALHFGSGSGMTLNGGVYRSTTSTDFGGCVIIGSGTSAFRIAGTATIQSAGSVSLTGDLRLENGNTVVEVNSGFGAFTGSGVVINGSGSTLTLLDGAFIDAAFENEGELILGTSAGQAGGTVFTQGSSGRLKIEIGGTSPALIDSLALSTSAHLDGILELSLRGGFTPVLGQTFTILTAPGITGSFETVIQPAGMPSGLKFEVVDNPGEIQLLVRANNPFEDWIDSFAALTDPADKTKNANPDNDRLSNLAEFALDGDPTSPVNSGKIVGKVVPVGGHQVFTLTFPVRDGAVMEPGDPAGGEFVLAQTTDEVIYITQAGDLEMVGGVTVFPLDVSEVSGPDAGAIQSGLPALSSGWEYRSFRSPGAVAFDPLEVMRVVIPE